MLSLTDPVGNTTTWSYDNLNRVTAETNELAKTRTFSYDAVGNLTRKIDRLGWITDYVYDNLYRLTAEKWLDEEEAVIRTLSFSYDAAGQLTGASDPAAAYGYQYDGLGRVIYQSQSRYCQILWTGGLS